MPRAFETGTESVVRALLHEYTGLESDEHGRNTPVRFLRMLDEMTSCRPEYADKNHLDSCIKWTQFQNTLYDEMVVETRIPFVSVCNHHIIPFVGHAHVAYIPDQFYPGLSKIPRAVQHFARQLQVQERMTLQITDFIEKQLKPLGLAVVIQAEHMCMTIRGVKAPGAITTTSRVRGVMADHSRTAKAEFLALINGGKS